MHVANFYLFNSYIPQEYREIIHNYYGYSGNNILKTDSISTFDDATALQKGSSRYNLQFNYLINDDIQLGIQNSFGNITNIEGLGGLGGVMPLVRMAGSTTKKKGSQENIQNLNSLFNYSIWQKTDPLTVNLSIVLYAKTDPLIDVIIPTFALMSHCIIDYAKEDATNPDANNIYGFPGLSSFEALKIGQANDKIPITLDEEKNSKNNNTDDTFLSKLISLNINGLVNLKLAMIKNITPSFSKHTAKSNYTSKKVNPLNPSGAYPSSSYGSNTFEGDYPIYAELNLQIESITPADSNMLWEGALDTIRNKHLGINNGNYAKLDLNTKNSSQPA